MHALNAPPPAARLAWQGLLATALAAACAGCFGEGPPRFVDVQWPARALRGPEGARVLARVVDDGRVEQVEALLAPGGRRLDDPRLRVPLSQGRDGLWAARLPLPATGHLYFELEALDDEGRAALAPQDLPEFSLGPTSEAMLYVVRVHEPDTELPRDPCLGVECLLGETCHPQLGTCLPSFHCLLPGRQCEAGYACDERLGRCRLAELCAQVRCPDGHVCNERTGICEFEEGRLCAPCTHASDCKENGAECLPYPGGSACGRDCRFVPCPSGYACLRQGESLRQCVRESGRCD